MICVKLYCFKISPMMDSYLNDNLYVLMTELANFLHQ